MRRLVGTRLYDMAADPGQEQDLFEQQAPAAVGLLEAYGGWWQRVLPELREPVLYRVGSDEQAVVSDYLGGHLFVMPGGG